MVLKSVRKILRWETTLKDSVVKWSWKNFRNFWKFSYAGQEPSPEFHQSNDENGFWKFEVFTMNAIFDGKNFEFPKTVLKPFWVHKFSEISIFYDPFDHRIAKGGFLRVRFSGRTSEPKKCYGNPFSKISKKIFTIRYLWMNCSGLCWLKIKFSKSISDCMHFAFRC